MEEGSEERIFPFRHSLERTKIARSDDNLVDTRTDQDSNNFRITFEFQILKCIENGNGDTEVIEEEFYEKKDWICSQFISIGAFQSIFDRLKLSGFGLICIEQLLKETLEKARLAESDSKKSSSQDEQELLSLCIYKFENWEDAIDENSEDAIDELTSVEENNQVPATKESIDALEKVKLEDGVSGSGEKCVICCENLWQGTSMEATSLPCSHLFHGNCIVEWLNISHLCPLCRYEMPTSPDTTALISSISLS